jgi:hypothetical protein
MQARVALSRAQAQKPRQEAEGIVDWIPGPAPSKERLPLNAEGLLMGAAECRNRCCEMRELAEQPGGAATRKEVLRIAAKWSEMAAQLERMAILEG